MLLERNIRHLTLKRSSDGKEIRLPLTALSAVDREVAAKLAKPSPPSVDQPAGPTCVVDSSPEMPPEFSTEMDTERPEKLPTNVHPIMLDQLISEVVSSGQFDVPLEAYANQADALLRLLKAPNAEALHRGIAFIALNRLAIERVIDPVQKRVVINFGRGSLGKDVPIALRLAVASQFGDAQPPFNPEDDEKGLYVAGINGGQIRMLQAHALRKCAELKITAAIPEILRWIARNAAKEGSTAQQWSRQNLKEDLAGLINTAKKGSNEKLQAMADKLAVNVPAPGKRMSSVVSASNPPSTKVEIRADKGNLVTLAPFCQITTPKNFEWKLLSTKPPVFAADDPCDEGTFRVEIESPATSQAGKQAMMMKVYQAQLQELKDYGFLNIKEPKMDPNRKLGDAVKFVISAKHPILQTNMHWAVRVMFDKPKHTFVFKGIAFKEERAHELVKRSNSFRKLN